MRKYLKCIPIHAKPNTVEFKRKPFFTFKYQGKSLNSKDQLILKRMRVKGHMD